jgi:hypothetical protein
MPSVDAADAPGHQCRQPCRAPNLQSARKRAPGPHPCKARAGSPLPRIAFNPMGYSDCNTVAAPRAARYDALQRWWAAPEVKPARRRRERKRVCQQERGTIEQATAIMGLPQRTVQALAARGDLPGAAKFGRVWTFDLARLRRHVKDKEKETWRTGSQRLPPDATGAAIPSGAGLKSMGATSDGRFTQATRRLREHAARRGKSG